MITHLSPAQVKALEGQLDCWWGRFQCVHCGEDQVIIAANKYETDEWCAIMMKGHYCRNGRKL